MTAYALPEGMGSEQSLELRDHLPMQSECQVGVNALLDRDDAELLEGGYRLLGEGLVGEIRQRRAAPKRECASQ